MDQLLLKNVNLVLEDTVLYRSSLLIVDGKIEDIGIQRVFGVKVFDGGGAYVLSGFVDIHCDAIEREIEVRPGVEMPHEMAIIELDKKLALSGVTTIFHSISFAESKKDHAVLRTLGVAENLARLIRDMSFMLSVENRIHVRYEITCNEAIPKIEALIKEGLVSLVSVMDHSPGQGQFKTLEQFLDYYGKYFKENMDNVGKVIKNKLERRENYGLRNAILVSEICKNFGLPLASHDDDTKEKIDFVAAQGATISEFPMSLDVAYYAKEKGLKIAVGAPNVVRGKSHNNNLRALDLIRRGLVDVICSDYMPSALLYALHKLVNEEGMAIYEASKLLSLNPAKALKLDHEIGRIAKGLKANLILVYLHERYPRLISTFVQGRCVYSAGLFPYLNHGRSPWRKE